MEDITDWVPAYGFDATNARTRTLLFIEDKKEQMLDLYYQFLNHAYGGRYRNPSMRALFYDTLTGEREPIYYQSAITFMVSRVIGKPIGKSQVQNNYHVACKTASPLHIEIREPYKGRSQYDCAEPY